MTPEPYEARHRAGRDELDETFNRIGQGLKVPVTAYDIGGGPMVYRRLAQEHRFQIGPLEKAVRLASFLSELMVTPTSRSASC